MQDKAQNSRDSAETRVGKERAATCTEKLKDTYSKPRLRSSKESKAKELEEKAQLVKIQADAGTKIEAHQRAAAGRVNKKP